MKLAKFTDTQSRVYILLLASMLLLVFSSKINAYAYNEDKTVVTFRYDDYHVFRTGSESVAKLTVEKEMLEIFNKYDVPLTIGVIPRGEPIKFTDPYIDALLTERDKILKDGLDKGIIEIALHGWTHTSVRNTGRHSEFDGLPFSVQFQKIKEGKKILEEAFGVPVVTFIPPWDSYDENTVKAVFQTGMKSISATKGQPTAYSTIRLLPHLCALTEINQAIKEVSSVNGVKFIIVLFHDSTFSESGSKEAYTNLATLKKVVANVSKNPKLILMTLGEAATEFASELGDGRYEELNTNYNLIKRHNQIPFFGRIVNKVFSGGVYYPVSYYSSRNCILLLLYWSYYALSALSGVIVGVVLINLMKKTQKPNRNLFLMNCLWGGIFIFLLLDAIFSMVSNPGVEPQTKLVIIFCGSVFFSLSILNVFGRRDIIKICYQNKVVIRND